MKTALQDHKFEEPEQLLDGIHDILNEMQSSDLMCILSLDRTCAVDNWT
jgi:hypothetical protein